MLGTASARAVSVKNASPSLKRKKSVQAYVAEVVPNPTAMGKPNEVEISRVSSVLLLS